MDVFVARQPIFDARLDTFAYELLFRDSLENYFPDIDGDTASSALLSNSFLCMGVEKLTGGKRAFINFTRELLLKRVPALFSPKMLYSELLETLEPDDALIDAVTRMRKKGCRFALDDFVFHEKYKPLIGLADIIKIDIRQTPLEETRGLVAQYAGDIRFLAEKVETREEYKTAVDMGYAYFQGYFFSKPEIIRQRSLAPFKMRLLEILGELGRDDADFHRLEELIKSDVSLSYRLLKYMNSAFFNLPGKVTSLKGAIVFLGLEQVRRIVTLLITAKLAESKPNELIRLSIVRAKMCELAGSAGGYRGDLSELFLLGLFSLMDAILDVEMEQIVGQLPVSDHLKRALVAGEGEMADYLKIVSAFEKGEWHGCPELKHLGEAVDLTVEKYMEAIGWADSLAGVL